MKLALEGGSYEYMLDSRHQNPDKVAIHQLVAIAGGADAHKVFSDEWHVHHIDGMKWNNSVENLTTIRAEDHGRGHNEMDLPVSEIVEMYEDGNTSRQIADTFDCSQPPILKRLHEAGVEVRPAHP